MGYLCFQSTDNAGFAKAVGPISGSPLLLAVSLSFKYSVDLEPMGNENCLVLLGPLIVGLHLHKNVFLYSYISLKTDLDPE